MGRMNGAGKVTIVYQRAQFVPGTCNTAMFLRQLRAMVTILSSVRNITELARTMSGACPMALSAPLHAKLRSLLSATARPMLFVTMDMIRMGAGLENLVFL